jgi:molybdopterin adenylyltransferase
VRILVLTISDRAFRGEYEDLSGPAVRDILLDSVPGCEVRVEIVPDDEPVITGALERGLGGDVIITTGGTGLGPRDITPEVTKKFCERAVPGLSEMLRAESLKETPNSTLSRGFAGVRGSTLIVNIPGSVKGASFCVRLLAPLLEHAVGMMGGEGH